MNWGELEKYHNVFVSLSLEIIFRKKSFKKSRHSVSNMAVYISSTVCLLFVLILSRFLLCWYSSRIKPHLGRRVLRQIIFILVTPGVNPFLHQQICVIVVSSLLSFAQTSHTSLAERTCVLAVVHTVVDWLNCLVVVKSLFVVIYSILCHFGFCS
jgi:hypothetical protein